MRGCVENENEKNWQGEREREKDGASMFCSLEKRIGAHACMPGQKRREGKYTEGSRSSRAGTGAKERKAVCSVCRSVGQKAQTVYTEGKGGVKSS